MVPEYLPFRIPKDSLEKTLKDFKWLNIRGYSVTIPHKEEAVTFGSTDKIAAEIGRDIGSVSPPDSANPMDVFERASIFDGWVDAMNATDGSGANCHMSSVGVCSPATVR